MDRLQDIEHDILTLHDIIELLSNTTNVLINNQFINNRIIRNISSSRHTTREPQFNRPHPPPRTRRNPPSQSRQPPVRRRPSGQPSPLLRHTRTAPISNQQSHNSDDSNFVNSIELSFTTSEQDVLNNQVYVY